MSLLDRTSIIGEETEKTEYRVGSILLSNFFTLVCHDAAWACVGSGLNL
jgi:hypothetical protein